MLYMLLIYGPPSGPLDEEKLKRHYELAEQAREAGVYVVAEALRRVDDAKTVRNDEGGIVTDGPFAETKEVLGGFYLLDCKDFDEAVSYARQIPTKSVEIRPVALVPGWRYDIAPDRERVPR